MNIFHYYSKSLACEYCQNCGRIRSSANVTVTTHFQPNSVLDWTVVKLFFNIPKYGLRRTNQKVVLALICASRSIMTILYKPRLRLWQLGPVLYPLQPKLTVVAPTAVQNTP